LFSSKPELFLELNLKDRVTLKRKHRSNKLHDVLIVPRAEQPFKIWLGTGGSPAFVFIAAQLGVPMFLGILGGTPEHWTHYELAHLMHGLKQDMQQMLPLSGLQCMVYWQTTIRKRGKSIYSTKVKNPRRFRQKLEDQCELHPVVKQTLNTRMYLPAALIKLQTVLFIFKSCLSLKANYTNGCWWNAA